MKKGAPLFIFLSLTMAAGAGFLLDKTRELAAPGLRIAVPDDAGGLLVHYVLNTGKFHDAAALSASGTYALKDCCAVVSEWAFSADALDMAVMCPDAAAKLTEKDPRFEILGPCVLNSDAIVIRPGRLPGRIGISQKRGYQERLVFETFGANCSIAPMLPAALPYAYEKAEVDGVVLDVFKAAFIDGDRISIGTRADTVTYVLTVKKSFKSNPLFGAFMEACSRAVAELGNPAVLAREVEVYKGVRWTEREIEEWQNLKVKIVFPEKRD
jgi:hypothetical protein